MKAKPETFDEYVVHSILANNPFGIIEVVNLRSIRSMYFEREKYPLIISLIKDQNLSTLSKLPQGVMHNSFQEYLEIVQFESQDGQSFIATVYDSMELWQNPQIIEIFSSNRNHESC
jgi:hypothetical protein